MTRVMLACRAVTISNLLTLALPAAAAAHTCGWIGAGSNNLWSTPANWTGCGPTGRPANGDDIHFATGAARGVNENDLVGLSVRAILIRGTAVPSQTRWSISGLPIIVTEILDVASTPPEANGVGSTFLVPLILGANVIVSNKSLGGTMGALDLGHIDLNGFTASFELDFDVRVRGTVVGTGSIGKSGVATLTLTEDNSYTGWTVISRGTIIAPHAHALGASGGDAPTLVLSNGILQLAAGTIDEHLFVSGLVTQGAGATTTVAGEVTLNTGGNGLLRVAGTLTVTGRILENDPGGVLYKEGPGTLVVSNPGNRWSTMVVRQGRVRVGAAGALPDAAIVELAMDPSPPTLDLNGIDETIGPLFGDAVGRVLIGSATLTINSVTPSIYGGAIAGGGTLRKTGASSQTFKGPQALSFTGTTIVQGGTLILEKSVGAGLLGPVVVNGGFLILGASHQIDDAVPVTVNAPGTLVLPSNTGERIGSLSGDGEVQLTQALFEIGANNASTIFAGTFSGTGQVLKIGSGTLTLTGDSPQPPSIGSGEGTLLINGTLGPLADVFAEPGTVGGTGRVGTLQVSEGLNRGVISPGAGPGPGPGILHAASASIPAATLIVELNGPDAGTGYDQLDVAGNVTLLDASPPAATAVLQITRGFAPSAGTSFTIINVGAGGTIAGAFDGLAEGATLTIGGQRFTITYRGGDGNDVVVTALDGPPTRSYFLSEGATGGFFDDDVLIANPNDAIAEVTLTFFKENGGQIVTSRTLAAKSHATVHVDQLPGLEATAASVRVTSEDGLPLLVERTMFWDSTSYAGHTGSAIDEPRPDWFFAEGSQGFFDTFVLVVNPNANATDVTFTFLLENEPPVIRTMPLGAFSRLTLDARSVAEIADRSFGITVHATQPIMAERSMYFGSTPTRLWSGGHESAGVAAPSTHWFLAEGATGGFFDTFLLLSNPQDTAAQVTLDYLLDSVAGGGGDPIRVTKTLPPRTRLTTNIEAEDDPRLRDAAVSTVVVADVPIIAERSMYWPGAAMPWGEGHNSFGVVNAHTHWGLAEGRVGGPLNFHTYILLANPELTAAEITLTYLRESGAPVVKTYVVAPKSRFTVDTSAVSELQNEAFGAEIVVTNNVPIVVERSLYWDAHGISFSGGTNATGLVIP